MDFRRVIYYEFGSGKDSILIKLGDIINVKTIYGWYTGRLKDIEGDQIVLDVSKKYKSDKRFISIDNIVGVKLLEGEE